VLPLPGRVFVPSLRNGPSEIRDDTLLNHWRNAPDRAVVPVRRLRSAEEGSPLPCGPAETRVPVPACSCGSLMFLDVLGALPPAARLDPPGEEPVQGARRPGEAATLGTGSLFREYGTGFHSQSFM